MWLTLAVAIASEVIISLVATTEQQSHPVRLGDFAIKPYSG
jgi:hypothetical protein